MGYEVFIVSAKLEGACSPTRDDGGVRAASSTTIERRCLWMVALFFGPYRVFEFPSGACLWPCDGFLVMFYFPFGAGLP